MSLREGISAKRKEIVLMLLSSCIWIAFMMVITSPFCCYWKSASSISQERMWGCSTASTLMSGLARFLPFSTNCVACGFEKGFSLIALKVGHFLSCIFHQDSLVQKETLDVSLPGVPTSCRVARPRRPPQQPQRLSSSSPSKKQSQKQSH